MIRSGLHRLDPESARKRIAATKSNKPFMAALLDRDHRGHKDAVEQWTRLHQVAYPAPEPLATNGRRNADDEILGRAGNSREGGRGPRPLKQTQQGTAVGPQFRHIDPYPGGPQGPIITFYNDVPGGPSRDLPVRDQLAAAVEAAALRVGLNVNVNSTRRSNSSRHDQGRAVDINRINDMRVDDPRNRANVERLQREFMSLPNVNQVLGPVYNFDIYPSGRTDPVTKQSVINNHRDHVHINVRR